MACKALAALLSIHRESTSHFCADQLFTDPELKVLEAEGCGTSSEEDAEEAVKHTPAK